MDCNFYVYFHRRNDTGEVFYVGKGRGNRAESVAGRTYRWCAVACVAGRTVEYVKTNITEQEALRLERDVIAALRKVGLKLTNAGGIRPVKPPRGPSRARLVLKDKACVRTWYRGGARYPTMNKSIHWLVLTHGCSREELHDVVNGKISTTSDGWSLIPLPRIQR